MSEEGVAFYNGSVYHWKKVLNHNSMGYEILNKVWEKWLKDDGEVVNTDTWRSKNICTLLETRVQVLHQHGK